MTTEKAIDVLRDIATEIDDFCHGAKHWRDKDREEIEALDMAIKALNVTSTTEQSSIVDTTNNIINEINKEQISKGRPLALYEMRPIIEKYMIKKPDLASVK